MPIQSVSFTARKPRTPNYPASVRNRIIKNLQEKATALQESLLDIDGFSKDYNRTMADLIGIQRRISTLQKK